MPYMNLHRYHSTHHVSNKYLPADLIETEEITADLRWTFKKEADEGGLFDADYNSFSPDRTLVSVTPPREKTGYTCCMFQDSSMC